MPILLGRHAVAPTRRGDAGQSEFRNRPCFKAGIAAPSYSKSILRPWRRSGTRPGRWLKSRGGRRPRR